MPSALDAVTGVVVTETGKAWAAEADRAWRVRAVADAAGGRRELTAHHHRSR
jgi:hypothetical protein